MSDYIADSTVYHHAVKSAGSGKLSAARGFICAKSDLRACAERNVAEDYNVVRAGLVFGGGGSWLY